MLTNQILVRWFVQRKANLLTPGCGDEKCSIYCKAEQGVWVANAKKSKVSDGFQGRVFKDKLREKVASSVVSFTIL